MGSAPWTFFYVRDGFGHKVSHPARLKSGGRNGFSKRSKASPLKPLPRPGHNARLFESPRHDHDPQATRPFPACSRPIRCIWVNYLGRAQETGCGCKNEMPCFFLLSSTCTALTQGLRLCPARRLSVRATHEVRRCLYRGWRRSQSARRCFAQSARTGACGTRMDLQLRGAAGLARTA